MLKCLRNSEISLEKNAKRVHHVDSFAVVDKVQELIKSGQEDAFVVVDINTVREQLKRWRNNLPRVSPWYAVKCHPDEEIMKALFDGGCGFDAASIAEIKSALQLGTSPDNIVFANPCKQPSHIRFAESVGVRLMTFDNVEEMRKIAKCHSSARLIVRVLGDDSSSVCKFNAKFGVSVADCVPLIKEAKRIGSEIVGVSFHVGSGCRSATAFAGAIENARKVFDMLLRAGFEPSILDLGGGWPGSLPGEDADGEVTFEDSATVVRESLDDLFPEDVQIIAEPGRYFAHACATAVVNVTSKRPVFAEAENNMPNLVDALSSSEDEVADEIIGFRYYVNDGVYGTFNAVICDHRDNVEPSMVLSDCGRAKDFAPVCANYPSSIWGNSCDGIDKISNSVNLPELEVGEWLLFESMGAYTTSAASAGFNGFPVSKKYYVNI